MLAISGTRLLRKPPGLPLAMQKKSLETFGAFIKRHRVRADIKQDALALKAGMSQSYVSGIERGVNVDVDPKYVIALADALDIPRQEAQAVARATMGFVEMPQNEIEYIVDVNDLTIEGYRDYDVPPDVEKQARVAARRAATEAAKNTYGAVFHSFADALRGARDAEPAIGRQVRDDED